MTSKELKALGERARKLEPSDTLSIKAGDIDAITGIIDGQAFIIEQAYNMFLNDIKIESLPANVQTLAKNIIITYKAALAWSRGLE